MPTNMNNDDMPKNDDQTNEKTSEKKGRAPKATTQHIYGPNDFPEYKQPERTPDDAARGRRGHFRRCAKPMVDLRGCFKHGGACLCVFSAVQWSRIRHRCLQARHG